MLFIIYSILKMHSIKSATYIELPVNIDFDKASREWMKNKIKKNSLYIYKCKYVDKNNNNDCKNKVMNYTKKHKQYKLETQSHFCVKHYHNRKNMKK